MGLWPNLCQLNVLHMEEPSAVSHQFLWFTVCKVRSGIRLLLFCRNRNRGWGPGNRTNKQASGCSEMKVRLVVVRCGDLLLTTTGLICTSVGFWCGRWRPLALSKAVKDSCVCAATCAGVCTLWSEGVIGTAPFKCVDSGNFKYLPESKETSWRLSVPTSSAGLKILN